MLDLEVLVSSKPLNSGITVEDLARPAFNADPWQEGGYRKVYLLEDFPGAVVKRIFKYPANRVELSDFGKFCRNHHSG